MAEHPLLPAVEAVPDAIAEVGTWPVGRRITEAEQHADTIGSGADVLSVTDPRKLRRAEVQPEQVREAVAFGLAILAHRPGGVEFGRLHWCAVEHPGCAGRGALDLPGSAPRGDLGAFFTPRDLAEGVATPTLEGTLYRPGPLDTADRGQWRLLPSTEILAKRTGDIAVGSGVFLLAALRYYSARLCEAWHVEAGLPADTEPGPAMTLAGRHRALGCLYGLDIDPTSVDLCRLALALMAPTVPVDLTHTIRRGDALLGITSWEHIARMSLDPEQPRVFGPGEVEFLRQARHFDPAVQALPWGLADLVVGAGLQAAGKSKRARSEAWGEAGRLGRRLFDEPAVWLESTAKVAGEWLNTDLPDGKPPRRPFHYPLAWPEVFGYGTDLSFLRRKEAS